MNAQIKPTRTVHYPNFLDLILNQSEFDRVSALAALRSLASSVQYHMISAADWKVRKEMGLVPDQATLDRRNEQDEFARGEDEVNQQMREMTSNEKRQTPEEAISQYGDIYWVLVEEIKDRKPLNEYERPKCLAQVVDEYGPMVGRASEGEIAARKAVEMEPGEFDKANAETRAKRIAELAERKPRILEILEDAKNFGDTDDFLQLPAVTQLKLACSAWKGLYYRRKGLVTLVSRSNSNEELGQIRLLQADMEKIENWCRDFEEKHSDLLTLIDEAGIRVTTIADAKHDVKTTRN